MSTAVAYQPRVLADAVPRVRARDLALVVAAAALTAACAQITIHIPGLTVPITGQTFAVLVFGATGGYLVGFLVAGWAVGKLAEARMDRTPLRAAPAFLLGTAIIYAIGVPWLAIAPHSTLGAAVADGFTPFIPGDL